MAPVTVAVGTICALAVLGAAAGGPWIIEERFNFDFNLIPPTEPTAPSQEAGPLPENTSELWFPDLTWIGITLSVVFALIALLAVVYAANSLRYRNRWRDSKAPHYYLLPESDAADVPAVQEGLELARKRLVDTVEPADAVIAAWIAMEDAAEASGIARRPSQTPTEFTVAVLDVTGVEGEPARRLLGVYHRARFSNRAVDDDDVRTALECLDRLARGWEELRQSELVASSTDRAEE